MEIEITADEMWVGNTRQSDNSSKVTFMFGEYLKDQIGELKKYEGRDLHYILTIKTGEANG